MKCFLCGISNFCLLCLQFTSSLGYACHFDDQEEIQESGARGFWSDPD